MVITTIASYSVRMGCKNVHLFVNFLVVFLNFLHVNYRIQENYCGEQGANDRMEECVEEQTVSQNSYTHEHFLDETLRSLMHHFWLCCS